MLLDEISLAAQGLYRDESPEFTRGVLSDALADLPRSKSWPEWLEESGTLQRLAELMCIMLGRAPNDLWNLWRLDEEARERVTQPHYDWRRKAGIKNVMNDPPPWINACRAWGVPPVMIEVDRSCPALSLARSVLERALALADHPPEQLVAEIAAAIKPEVFRANPYTTAYRLRCGEGAWLERASGNPSAN
jgi:hypothetical protein